MTILSDTWSDIKKKLERGAYKAVKGDSRAKFGGEFPGKGLEKGGVRRV